MRSVCLSLRWLKRDWSSGELRLMSLALVVAVAAVTTVTFFTDRVQRAMALEANAMLAADLAIEFHNTEFDQTFLERAVRIGLQTARTTTFRSMIAANDRLKLAEVKAVDAAYPLRGELRIRANLLGAPGPTTEIPAPGEAWAEAQLFQTLGVEPGDGVELGQTTLRLTKMIAFEPDRGGEFFHIAPRLLLNLQDLPATGLLLPGSRFHHRLLTAGSEQQIDAFRSFAEPRLDRRTRLLGIRDTQPALRTALERADKFLGLAALVAVFLSCVTIAMTVRRYIDRHLDGCAVMRCIGASQHLILWTHGLELLWVGAAASVIGVICAYLAQAVLCHLVSGLTASALPLPSLYPPLTGAATGLISLLGFGMPPLMALRSVPPARVLQHHHETPIPPFAVVYLGALGAVTLLLGWHIGERQLTLYALLGSLATMSALAACAWLVIKAMGLLRSRVGVSWRFGFSNIARRGRRNVIQTVALGLGIMVMLVLTIVRDDLLADWQAKLPPHAPNHFVINVQPQQAEPMRRFFQLRGLPEPVLYPIVHARLETINGRKVVAESYGDDRARRLANREYHLTWLARPPDDNRIIDGQWWEAAGDGALEFSVESGIAETLGIELGDSVGFDIEGRKVGAPVTSVRQVDWGSFKPNFFFVLPPGYLGDVPATLITSFYLAEDTKHLTLDLVQDFPNITVLDIAAIITQIRDIIARVTVAVEFIMLFTLAAGILVIFASIHATQDERKRENALLRTFGADRGMIRRALIAEFASLGLVAGIVAGFGASLVAYILSDYVFEIGFHFNPALLIAGAIGGTLLVSAAGVVGIRSVLKTPPILTLREN